MRDFPFWRGAIYKTKTPQALKSAEEDLANFQKEPVFNSNEPKLTNAQVKILSKLVSDKMAEFSSHKDLRPK